MRKVSKALPVATVVTVSTASTVVTVLTVRTGLMEHRAEMVVTEWTVPMAGMVSMAETEPAGLVVGLMSTLFAARMARMVLVRTT